MNEKQDVQDKIRALETAIAILSMVNKGVDSVLGERLAGIAKQHAMAALGAPLIPVPGLDIVALVANQWVMYARINKELGISLEKEQTKVIAKSVAAGMASNLAANAVGLTVGEALKAIPGLGALLGGAILFPVMYAAMITSAIVYMKAVSLIFKTGVDFTEQSLDRAVKSVLAEENLREIFERVKDAYREKGQ